MKVNNVKLLIKKPLLEALQIVLVKKGQSAPGNNYGGIISKNTMAYIAR